MKLSITIWVSSCVYFASMILSMQSFYSYHNTIQTQTYIFIGYKSQKPLCHVCEDCHKYQHGYDMETNNRDYSISPCLTPSSPMEACMQIICESDQLLNSFNNIELTQSRLDWFKFGPSLTRVLYVHWVTYYF